MAKQEKRISYQAGITRTPSDFLCQDGELAECINLTTDNEELKPVVQPAEWLTAASGSTLPGILYVHRINGNDIIIGSRLSGGSYTLEYGKKNENDDTYDYIGNLTVGGETLSKETKPVNVISTGRILVVSYEPDDPDDPDDTYDAYYFLFEPDGNGGSYKGLGSELPDISVEFSTDRPMPLADFGQPNAFPLGGLIHHDPVYRSGVVGEFYYRLYTEDNSEYEGVKNMIVGCVSQRLRKVADERQFAFPFWARYAVRLYDGTYTRISQPFLVFPTVSHNCDIYFSDENGDPYHLHNRDWGNSALHINYRPVSTPLLCKIVADADDLSDWQDIISGVDIFVSEDQKPFTLDEDWYFINPFDPDRQAGLTKYNYSSPNYVSVPVKVTDWDDATPNQLGFVTYFGLSHITQSEIIRGLIDKSSFYKIAEIDRAEFGDFSTPAELGDKIQRGALRNLTSQTRLGNDDYFSRNAMTASVMKSYNSRLHLAGVTRSFFEGFDKFTYAQYPAPQEADYKIVVDIKTDSGSRTVIKESAGSRYIMNLWFYYPDPRAKRVRIYRTSGGSDYLLYDLPLTEHKGLNGAYFFHHLPDGNDVLGTGTRADEPTKNDDPEQINDRVFVSEADNPFVFNSRGDVKVGQGDIIGLATQTVALGQEEHGIHPMIVFTDRGVSVLRVGNDGQYVRSDELNREVCINPKSITETDGAVFFVSKKGLMVLAGEAVKCVSERMNGRAFDTDGFVDVTGNAAPWAETILTCGDDMSFQQFITSDKCLIAYDYIDSRLWLIRDDKAYAFVYNMSDGAISKTVLPGNSYVKAVVANYPDYIMESYNGNTVYSLYGKQREEEVNARQKAFLLTRPIKLAGPLTVSSLRELASVGMWDKGTDQAPLSCVKTMVWLSDDMKNWHLMSSRFGAAAKYFRIGLFIDMLPTERLSGTIIMEQERRTDNERV